MNHVHVEANVARSCRCQTFHNSSVRLYKYSDKEERSFDSTEFTSYITRHNSVFSITNLFVIIKANLDIIMQTTLNIVLWYTMNNFTFIFYLNTITYYTG